MTLPPFFTYFGGKWRAAPKYPRPIHGTIIEPFAGSAGYSLRYADRKIILIEKSEAIAGIWRYLIGATEREILALPLLERGQSIDAIALPQEARGLLGMWVGRGLASPRKSLSIWPARPEDGSKEMCSWSAVVRARIARGLHRIRHWIVRCADYREAPDVEATWFIDPPYETQGVNYACGSADLDFTELAGWCRSRRGQVMVCEATGAAWLPFQSFGAFKSAQRTHGRVRSAEALWMNEWPGSALWLPARGIA